MFPTDDFSEKISILGYKYKYLIVATVSVHLFNFSLSFGQPEREGFKHSLILEHLQSILIVPVTIS